MPTGYAGTSPVGKPREAPEKSECLGSGGSTVARLKLKGIDGRAPPGVEPAAQFDSTRGSLPGPDTAWIDRLRLFHDSVGGGAWPLLARGAIRLVHSDNGRDSALADNKRRSRGARLTGLVGVRPSGRATAFPLRERRCPGPPSRRPRPAGIDLEQCVREGAITGL